MHWRIWIFQMNKTYKQAVIETIVNSQASINKSITSDTDIQKALKHMLMAGALGASSLMSSPTSQEQLPPKPQTQAPALAKPALETAQIQKPDRKHLLEALKFVESSGGKLTDHAWIDKGPHAGTRAIGSFAFMPKTVHELVGKSPKLKAKYGGVLERDSQGGVEDFFTENPKFETDLANHYVDQIFSQTKAKTPGDVGYAWLNGITGLNNAHASGKDLSSDERHQKMTAAYNNSKKLHDTRVTTNIAMKKK